ncbi:MAG: hypothetical protein JWM91_4249 [Rhodospirillales bacterium]|nr:hypothetical protein [Rhodospirillales bacterium]
MTPDALKTPAMLCAALLAVSPASAQTNTDPVDATRPSIIASVIDGPSADSTVHIPTPSGIGSFSIAVKNTGDLAYISAKPGTGGQTLPVTLSVCQTNLAQQCLAAAAPFATTKMVSGSSASFAVFVTGKGSTAAVSPAKLIYVKFYDGTGALRGSTSVPITVPAATVDPLARPAPTPPPAPNPAPSQPGSPPAIAHRTPLPAIKATSAAALLDTIGVNTHIDFAKFGYQNLTVTEASINYLGIKNLRDSAQNSTALTLWHQVAAATGAKFDDYLPEASPANVTADLAYASTLAGQGILNYLEGGNEEDDTYPIGQGNSIGWTASFQQQVFATGRQLRLPVINMSFGAGWTAGNNWHGDYDKVGDLSPYADYANAHTYPNVGQSPAAGIAMLNADALLAAKSRPIITTEIGWKDSSTSQADAARFALDAVFDGVRAGDVKMYFYALFDDSSGKFGLMNQDGSPKPAGSALHNLAAILADAGAARTDSLAYTLSGTTANDRTLLLEKSGGVFELVVWNEKDAAHNVNLTLESAAGAISVYEPLAGTMAKSTSSGAASLAVATSDCPLIIEIVPAMR